MRFNGMDGVNLVFQKCQFTYTIVHADLWVGGISETRSKQLI